MAPEVVADAPLHNFGDSFRSSCQPWPYSKPTVSRRNEYGRIRWTWASFQKEYREIRPMNIVRYLRYPRGDLSAALDRITSMRAELDRMYDSTFGSSFRSPASLSGWNPAVNVYQDKEQFIVVAELPGLKKEEIEISLHDNTLALSGERKREGSSEQGLLTERFYGKYQRSVTLPTAVDPDKVTATYKDGLLQVVLPKAEEAKPKQIEVALK